MSIQSVANPWPYFESDEIRAVSRVLQSGKVNYWTGDEGKLFEKEFAEFVGTKYAVALANGTVALEAALYALNISEGDEVIVTPRTFIASASCAVVRGAKPVFADVDPVSQNVTAETIQQVITPQTKAIICVHLAGWPCDMDSIMELAKKYHLYVIEDCAQAHGAKYKGKMVGSLGHIAAFSFCQDKIMTTGGEGGMITTNNEEWWARIWSYKDHGKNYHTVYDKIHPPGFRWLHEDFGTNWRMMEVQSAIGRIQLRKLPKWLEIRRRNATVLTEAFKNIPWLRTTVPPKEIEHAYYKYYVFVKSEFLKNGLSRDSIMQVINQTGVPCFSGSCSEIYLEKAFEQYHFQPKERLTMAKILGETSLMFLVHPTLTEECMRTIANTVKSLVILQ